MAVRSVWWLKPFLKGYTKAPTNFLKVSAMSEGLTTFVAWWHFFPLLSKRAVKEV